METRKVQLSGGTTYTVSLPKSWAQEQGIEAGSVLSLHPNGDGSLLVETATDGSARRRTARIDVSGDDADTVGQRIRALHAVGFDEVTLADPSGHPEGRRRAVAAAVGTLSGFELLEAGETTIRLRNLIDAENVDIRKSTLRLRLVMLGMHRDAVEALLGDDAALARQVIDRDAEADKLFAMVTRHFRRALTTLTEVEKLAYDRAQLFEFYYAARQFERVADHAVKIARFTLDSDATVPPSFGSRLTSLAEDARGVVDDAADVILDDVTVDSAHAALRDRDTLASDVRALDRELYTHEEPAEAYTVGLVLDSIRRTAEYGANVAEVAIQRTARSRDPP